MKKFEGFDREMIALRVSKEIEDGSYVNLGIGIPTLVSNWIEGRDIILQSENGMLKIGNIATEDAINQNLINASSQPVTEVPGSVYFDICDSFAMIRGGHIDVTVVGAYQVNGSGDYASWNNPSRGLDGIGNIGGAMDLAVGAKKLFIAMEHVTNDGKLKIVKDLDYPATAKKKVNMIFTDLAVIEVTPQGLLLKEVFPGLSPEDIQAVTGAELLIAHDLKEIEL